MNRWAMAMLLLTGCFALSGCVDREAERRAQQERRRTDVSTQTSLDDVMQTFHHLYDHVNLELQPPQVILDNHKTLDGEPALAVLGPIPGAQSPVSQLLSITSRNAPLSRLDIQPNDQIQYFIGKLDDNTARFAELQEMSIEELVEIAQQREIVAAEEYTKDGLIIRILQKEENQDEFLERLNMAEFEAVSLTVAQVVEDEHIVLREGRPYIVDLPHEVQILRYVDDQTQDIREQLGAYADVAHPPLGWQPSPDKVAFEHALNTLSQWMRHTFEKEAEGAVGSPPLLDTLPAAFRKSPRLAPYIAPKALADVSFDKREGRLIQEAIWLRNISAWARGDAVGDIELAKRLFDWTIRHIQLEEVESEEKAHHMARDPWEILLYGMGTAEQRAWVFAHLCRQQGLPAVLLYAPKKEAAAATDAEFWCAAIVSGDRLYLFDLALGLPIPTVDGQGVATLTEAAENSAVLEQLSLGEEHPYPWTHENVQHVQAMVVASPFSLTRRAALLQEQLVGHMAFVLADQPTAVAESIRQHKHVDRVALWPWPFEVLDRKLAMAVREGENATEHRRQRIRAVLDFRVFALQPHLWKARVLHFRGPSLAASTSATEASETGAHAVDGHRGAIVLYQAARASDRDIAAERSEEKRQTMVQAKEHATYWIGLLKTDQGRLSSSDDSDFEIAVSSWLPQVLAAEPASPWVAGARYNLARAYEALGQTDKAIDLYEKDDSPQQHGNRLRARWLRAGPLTSGQTAAR